MQSSVVREEPGGRPLTSLERVWLTKNVRLAFEYQRVFFEAVRSGVALGAQEVHDQRLAAAEPPPEADPSADVFLLLVTVALQAPVADRVVTSVRKMIVPQLRRQMRLQVRAYRELMRIDSSDTSALEQARAIATAAVKVSGRAKDHKRSRLHGRERRARRAIERSAVAQRELERLAGAPRCRRALTASALALNGVRSPDFAEYLIAVAKGVAPTDEFTGSSLRERVEKEALELIQETYLQQELCELGLAVGVTTVEQAAEVLLDIGLSVLPVDIGLVIYHFRALAAGMIWSRLLDAGRLRADRIQEQRARPRPGEPDPPLRALFAPSARHRDYLIARFGSMAEAWARENPADVLLPGVWRGPGPPSVAEVGAYLSAGTAKPASGILAEALGLAHQPEDWRLDLVVQWLGTMPGGDFLRAEPHRGGGP